MKFRVLLSKIYWKALRLLLGGRRDQFIRPVLQAQKAYNALGVSNNNYVRQSVEIFLSELKKAKISMTAMSAFQELGDARELQMELGGGADSARAGWVGQY